MEESRREELVERFLLSMGKMMRGMNVIFRREMERCDVTWTQFHLMRFVSREGHATVTDISNMLMISPPTASRMIDGLRAKKYLRKARDDTDHRVARIELTRDGRSLVGKLAEVQRGLMGEVLAGEDLDELEKTIDHLGRMTDLWLEIGERAVGKENR